MRKTIGLTAILTLAGAALAGEPGQSRVPVLLELFTSEGCSSCPPADRLLERLDREQGIGEAEVIALSEHVDYWNHLGWADPFSSSVYSERQRAYARRLDGQTYTPELVVDGAKGFVGSDRKEAERAIRDAARRRKSVIRIAAQQLDQKTRVSVHIEGIAEGILYLALAHNAVRSEVARGENAGRGLSHVAVAYSIERIGKMEPGKVDFERLVTLRSNSGTRIVAFVAQGDSGRVIGVSQIKTGQIKP